jgi:hypothetical protein
VVNRRNYRTYAASLNDDVEGGFAPGVTHWNLKDRPAGSESNRIGLVLRCSRLAQLSCWPRLPSEFETNFVTLSGVARSLAGAFGARLSDMARCLTGVRNASKRTSGLADDGGVDVAVTTMKEAAN